MDPPTSLKMDKFQRIQGASLIIENKNYPIFKGINTVGRNRDAVVNIKHLNVSQNQALIIVIDDTQHYISDMNSSNGTFILNTKAVPFKLYELTNNAEVKFGDISAVYSKISVSNRRVNLQETLDISEMTQNMTQNFYASNTQLIFSSKDASDHNYSNAEQPNNNAFSIHEEATQVADFPQILPKTQFGIHEASTQVADFPQILPKTQDQVNTAVFEECVIEEVVTGDIHDAPTQVCNFVEPLRVANIHDAATQVINFSKQANSNICEEAIQIGKLTLENVAQHSKEMSEGKSSDSNTQIMTIEERDEVVDRVSTKNKLIPEISINSEDTVNKDTPVLTNTEEENNIDKHQAQQIPKIIEHKKTNIIHDSQEPSTSGLGAVCKEYDESFLNSSKTSRTDDLLIEDTVVENMDSNDSIDFLTMDCTQNEDMYKSNSQCSVESDFIHRPKKKTLKLLNTQVDSDTDIEGTQDMVKTISKPIPKLPSTPINSETDAENTQDVGFRKKPIRAIVEDSDSETDMDTQENVVDKFEQKEKQKIDNSDSETDCELDDTDCIPATQDAFAKALGYKPTKSSQEPNTNQSSEESFKLGLTELMNFNESEKIEELKQQSSDNEVNQDTIQKKNSVNSTSNVENEPDDNEKKDEIHIKSTQGTLTSKKFIFKKKSVNLEGSLSTILSTNNQNDVETQKVDEIGNEISSKTTRSMGDDDIAFLQPTQSIGDDDNVFLQPTQLLDCKKSDDVFLKPPAKEDVFLQPTQSINFKEGRRFRGFGTQDDDVYLAPTQVIQESSAKITEDVIPMTQEDLYGQATQKINNICEDSSVLNNQAENLDVYMAATQQIKDNTNDDATDTQLEMPNFNGNMELEFSTGTNRPGNPLLRELDNETNQEIKTSLQSSVEDRSLAKADASSKNKISKMDITIDSNIPNKENLTETVSQIEDFIKKPLPPRKSMRKLKSNEELDSTKTSVSNVSRDSVETLSQIEAFVKKPLSPSEIKSVPKKPVKEDRPETLSQIVAFVNKPLPKNDNLNKQISATIGKEHQKQKATETVTAVSSHPTRISKRQSLKLRNENPPEDITGINKLEIINEDESLRDSDEETGKKDNSRETRSDVDQSFALLESKSTKIRRKPSTDAALNEIKVTVTSHRRSMGVAENKNPVLVIPLPKSKRSGSINTLNTTEIEVPPKMSRTRTSRVPSAKKIDDADKKPIATEKRIEDRTGTSKVTEHINKEMNSTDSNDSNIEVSSKISRTRNLQENSTGSKNEKAMETRGRKTEDHSTRITEKNKNNENRIKEAESKASNDPKIPRMRKSRVPSGSSKDEDRPTTREKNNENEHKNMSSTSANRRKKNEEKANSTSDDSVKVTENKSKYLEVPTKANKRNTLRKTINSNEEDLEQNQIKNNRTAKRHISDSSEDTSSPSTPAKYGRMSKRTNDVIPDGSRTKSTGSSHENETNITPRKSRNAPKMEALLSSVERTKRKIKPKVVFTMLESPQLESFIRYLGGSIVDTVDSATVLMTQNVKRSQKLLTAVAQGKPICAPNWIHDSKKKSEFLDPWDYILVDKEAEAKWNFSLKESLLRAENEKLLAGYLFHLMVSNALDVLKGAIEASGGKCVTKLPGKNQLDKYIIVASPEHKTKYIKMKKQNPEITVVEPEAIFDGVLRQELRLSMHILT